MALSALIALAIFVYPALAQAPANFQQIVEAHGILGSLAWVIFFPLGAILIKVIKGPNAWLIHAAVQSFALVLFVVNVGCGISAAVSVSPNLITGNYHPIIGLVLFGLVLLQPFSGWYHHNTYKKEKSRSIISQLHIWIGRAIITLGMINGGLASLWATDFTRAENIAYGVIAGIIWTTYVAIVIWSEVSGNKEDKAIKDESSG